MDSCTGSNTAPIVGISVAAIRADGHAGASSVLCEEGRSEVGTGEVADPVVAVIIRSGRASSDAYTS